MLRKDDFYKAIAEGKEFQKLTISSTRPYDPYQENNQNDYYPERRVWVNITRSQALAHFESPDELQSHIRVREPNAAINTAFLTFTADLASISNNTKEEDLVLTFDEIIKRLSEIQSIYRYKKEALP